MDRKEVCVTWNDVGARLRPITPMPWTMRSSYEIPPVQVEHDRHVEELFKRAEWLAFLQDAGFVQANITLHMIIRMLTIPGSLCGREACARIRLGLDYAR